MIERVWWASSPPLLVTVISRAMSSSVGVMTATPSFLMEEQRAQSCSPLWLNSSLCLTCWVIWKRFCRFPFVWSRTCTPNWGYFDKCYRCRSLCWWCWSVKNTHGGVDSTLSRILMCSCWQRCISWLQWSRCTSETVYFGWKRSSTGVTRSLVHWVESPRDAVTEMGIACSQSLKSRWKRSGHPLTLCVKTDQGSCCTRKEYQES